MVTHTESHPPEDKLLVNRVLRGDKGAFGVIVRNTEALVAQIVIKMIPGAEDRKDLAQDVYLKAFNHLGSFRFQSKLSTWIAQIAYNTCLSWIEKKKPTLNGDLQDMEFLISEGSSTPLMRIFEKDPERQMAERDLSRILQKEIEKLPPIYRVLIVLFHQENMRYDELVSITGLPEGTVKSHLFRARKMLRENLLMNYQKEAL
jgi:RNA polymerase sigma-70 factor (ECF subfamily)